MYIVILIMTLEGEYKMFERFHKKNKGNNSLPMVKNSQWGKIVKNTEFHFFFRYHYYHIK